MLGEQKVTLALERDARYQTIPPCVILPILQQSNYVPNEI